MEGDDNARLIYGLVMVMLLLGSLTARRLPIQQYLKMFLAWIAIFAGFFVIFSFRPEMQMVWDRVAGELTGAPRQSVEGDTIRLVRQDDGHFWVRAELNGHTTNLMVDSGATITAINGTSARAAGLDMLGKDKAMELQTANGTITAAAAIVRTLSVGNMELHDHDVVVSDSFGDTNVVGMNFLDEFESWNVTGNVMLLKPGQ